MATGSSKATSPNTELGEDDLKLLYNTLYRIRKKYALLGMQIGLKKSEIDDIVAQKLDPSMSLLEVLSVHVKKAEALTWNDIYNALRSECIDESKLAKEIWAEHLFIPESSTESESEQEHEIMSEEIKRVKKRSPKKQKGGDHRARVSKERERSSEDEGIETVRSRKHVQEVEREDEEDAVLSRKEKKEKVKRKGAHYQYKEVHDKERPKGKNKKERFMKDESQSEPEEVEKSKRKKNATHDREESVKGYGDRDHYSDTEVCEKVRKISKKHSKKREVYTESESEASSDEDEMENSSFEDDTSRKGSARRKLTKHKEVKIHLQKEQRKDGKKKYAKSRDNRYSDEEVSTKSAQKLRKSKKVETESEEESSFASSSDEEEIEVHKRTKKSKRTETKSAARTKDTAHYESEEKGKTSGKKTVSLKPKSATAKEASPCPEEYKDKGRKKAARVDERVGKSTDSSRETYHKTRSKPPRKDRDGKREVVSGMKSKKATAPPLERDLPSSEMAQTDSGDGESDDSSEDENELEQQSSDDEEETENDSTAEEKEEKRSKKSRKSKEKATHPTTETKSQDDDNSRGVKGKKLSKAAGAPSKDDSHGDKDESDAGGSRDQEDQPKKRNRRRHRESSKSPIVRGGSSPSSSQEERKPGSRRQRRTPNHGGKYKRKEKKKRRETSSSSSDTDSSSPESEMLKNLTKSEKKKLRKVFKYSFGQLCSASFNPVETAVQLQKKGLISQGMMIDIFRSPESQQDKIIRLVCGLDNRIRSRPERLFGCIEVLLENDALQEVGREMLRQTGKPFTHQAQSMFVMCISSFSVGVICPERTAAKFPRATPSSESAALSEVVGRYM